MDLIEDEISYDEIELKIGTHQNYIFPYNKNPHIYDIQIAEKIGNDYILQKSFGDLNLLNQSLNEFFIRNGKDFNLIHFYRWMLWIFESVRDI